MPSTTTPRPHKLTSVSRYLRGVTSATRRRAVRSTYRQALHDRGLLRDGDGWPGMNGTTRELLADAIFRVEDAIESRSGGQPDHPDVVQLREARLLVNRDMRWDETC